LIKAFYFFQIDISRLLHINSQFQKATLFCY